MDAIPLDRPQELSPLKPHSLTMASQNNEKEATIIEPSERTGSELKRLASPISPSSFSSSSNSNTKKKQKRRRIGQDQLFDLISIFSENSTPNYEQREKLAKKWGMTNREVQVWFQNRRAKVNKGLRKQTRSKNSKMDIPQLKNSEPKQQNPTSKASKQENDPVRFSIPSINTNLKLAHPPQPIYILPTPITSIPPAAASASKRSSLSSSAFDVATSRKNSLDTKDSPNSKSEDVVSNKGSAKLKAKPPPILTGNLAIPVGSNHIPSPSMYPCVPSPLYFHPNSAASIVPVVSPFSFFPSQYQIGPLTFSNQPGTPNAQGTLPNFVPVSLSNQQAMSSVYSPINALRPVIFTNPMPRTPTGQNPTLTPTMIAFPPFPFIPSGMAPSAKKRDILPKRPISANTTPQNESNEEKSTISNVRVRRRGRKSSAALENTGVQRKIAMKQVTEKLSGPIVSEEKRYSSVALEDAMILASAASSHIEPTSFATSTITALPEELRCAKKSINVDYRNLKPTYSTNEDFLNNLNLRELVKTWITIMPGPPPPPPPVAPPAFTPPPKSNDRNALLSSIHKGAKLKKTQTNDRSKPVVDSKPSAPSGNAPIGSTAQGTSSSKGPPMIGGLFEGGVPTLKKVSGDSRNRPSSIAETATLSKRTVDTKQADLPRSGSGEFGGERKAPTRPPPPPAGMGSGSLASPTRLPPPPPPPVNAVGSFGELRKVASGNTNTLSKSQNGSAERESGLAPKVTRPPPPPPASIAPTSSPPSQPPPNSIPQPSSTSGIARRPPPPPPPSRRAPPSNTPAATVPMGFTSSQGPSAVNAPPRPPPPRRVSSSATPPPPPPPTQQNPLVQQTPVPVAVAPPPPPFPGQASSNLEREGRWMFHPISDFPPPRACKF